MKKWTNNRRTRRLDRVGGDVERALRALRDGAALHLIYERGRPHWRLSGAGELSEEVARVVIGDRHVVAVDRALFHDLKPQSWRHAE